ncbi:hypothetical protein P22_2370 [Propionispora sp. 2/2-37]|uniref:flagellar motor protein MotB n=1 Tax=Propionispora sp. 2/2-37 TaxID=1677858 RepID=UPI0006BB8561|nr:flagellar motor protein MotB [Propionispora sp. 2/2-37]CUH96280.1 hypothetical protein P22_2370 [Propionispora sp. 2/2-37]
MAKKKHHAQQHEEHMDETWLIPYADLLTLLLAVFIVLFASSQIDQKKFEQISKSMSVAFGSGSPAIFDSMRVDPQSSDDPSAADSLAKSAQEQAYVEESAQLMRTKQILDKYIQDNGLTNELQTILTDEGLLIRIKDNALFPSGSADLLPDSRRTGGEIAKMLLPLSQKIIVSGHTDNVPINTGAFPSNWDLSTKRAVNFVKFLLSQEKIDPGRFSATGHGEFRPVASNDTEEGRAQNRRVEVLIARNYRLQ